MKLDPEYLKLNDEGKELYAKDLLNAKKSLKRDPDPSSRSLTCGEMMNGDAIKLFEPYTRYGSY